MLNPHDEPPPLALGRRGPRGPAGPINQPTLDGSLVYWQDSEGNPLPPVDYRGPEGPAGDSQNFPSVAIAAGSLIDNALDGVRVLGHFDFGDGGAAQYKRADTEPTHAGKFQSLDGAWWEIDEKILYVAQFDSLQGAADAALALNRALRFNGPLTVSVAVNLGAIDFGGTNKATSVLNVDAGITALSVNATGAFRLHDFSIVYPTGQAAGAIGVVVDSASMNQRSRIHDLRILNAYNGIVVLKAANWSIYNNDIDTSASLAGNSPIVLNLMGAATFGDSSIGPSNTLIGHRTNSLATIFHTGRGGVRIFGNKLATAQNGYLMQLNAAAICRNVLIECNSIENVANGVMLSRLDAGSHCSDVVVTGNHMTVEGAGLFMDVDPVGFWAAMLVLGNNAINFQGTGTCYGYVVNSTEGFSILGGVIDAKTAATKTRVFAGASAVNGVIGMIAPVGVFSASVVNSGNTQTIAGTF